MHGGLLPVVCLVVISSHPSQPVSQPASSVAGCKLVMRQGGWEVRLPQGSCVVFITGASAPCKVSKRLPLPSPLMFFHSELAAALFQSW